MHNLLSFMSFSRMLDTVSRQVKKTSVMPAQAAIHLRRHYRYEENLDSRLCGNDGRRSRLPVEALRKSWPNTEVLLVLTILIGIFSFVVPALAQPLEKLRLTYSAIGGSQASFWVPYEAGIFRKYGLDVELLYVAGGGRAAQVVQSGEVPIGVFTGGAVINSALAGGDLVVIASSMNVMTFVVMARPEIRRVEDLKGKKIGVSRFGSATDFGLRYVEEQWPVKRQRDFAVLQMGGVSDVYNALRAGVLDAAVINAELAILGRREGFRELADISKMGINFPTSSVITTRSYIKRNESTVRKFIRGFVEGVHYGKTQRAPTIKIMMKYLRSSDAAMFNELYDMYILQNIPRIPRPSPESLKTVIDQMAETDPRVASLKPEQFIDGRFFAELEKEGFIQKLGK